MKSLTRMLVVASICAASLLASAPSANAVVLTSCTVSPTPFISRWSDTELVLIAQAHDCSHDASVQYLFHFFFPVTGCPTGADLSVAGTSWSNGYSAPGQLSHASATGVTTLRVWPAIDSATGAPLPAGTEVVIQLSGNIPSMRCVDGNLQYIDFTPTGPMTVTAP